MKYYYDSDLNEYKELIELFQKCILEDIPIVKNRMEKMKRNHEILDIMIDFVNARKDMSYIQLNHYNQINVNGIIDVESLKCLFTYLLEDHDIVSNFIVDNGFISLELAVDEELSKPEGLLCKEIKVFIDFRKTINPSDLENAVLQMLITNFSENLKNTYYFREMQEEKRKNLTDFLTEQDLEKIKELLTKEDINKYLLTTSIERFDELYNEYQEQKEIGISRKLELKEENNE